MSRAGRAMGVDSAMGMNFGGLDQLEERKLLDGDFGTAVLIALDGAGQGSAGGTINPAVPSSNNDYYQFVAPTSDFVSVLADTKNELTATTLDTRVTIFNSAQQQIVVGADNGALTTGLARDGWAGFIATAGETYFIVVSRDGGGTSTDNPYTLRVDATSELFDLVTTPGGDAGIGAELDSPPPGNPVPPITPIIGTLERLQQDIVYRYDVPAGGEFASLVSINAQVTQANLNIRMDSRLDVYRASGSTGAVTRVAFDSDAGRLNDAFTTVLAAPGDTFYVRVRSDEVNVGREAFGTGTFFLVFDAAATEIPLSTLNRRGGLAGGAFVGFGDPSAPPPAPFPNVPAPGFQTAMFRFTALGNGLTIITGIPTGLAPVTDPALSLYDSTGTRIAFNDNFAGASPQLQIRLQGGRDYYVILDGFEVNNQVQFQLWIESNHTFDDTLVEGTIDDHIDTPGGQATPGAGLSEADRRRLSAGATSLVFNAPFESFDADGNLVRDLGLRQTATGEGRIFNGADTDLFKFTAPVDMLSGYAGDSDGAGSSLLIGGRFDVADPTVVRPTGSRGVTTYDVDDFWAMGNQQLIDTPGGPVQLGFDVNAAVSGKPEIYAMAAWDPDGAGAGREFLVVGGDFVLNYLNPLGQVETAVNLAIWTFTGGRYQWRNTLGDADGAVRAIATFDPGDPDGAGDLLDLNDDPFLNNVPLLFVGGDFNNIGGGAAVGVAGMFGSVAGIASGFLPLGDFAAHPDLGAVSVRAFQIYDPVDPGEGRPADADAGLDEVFDPIDAPQQLYIGGVFEAALENGVAQNLVRFDGSGFLKNPLFSGRDQGGTLPLPSFLADGAVNAMAVFDADGDGEDDFDRLYIGGEFTTIGLEGSEVAADRLAVLGRPDPGAEFDALDGDVQDPANPDYNPQIHIDALDGGQGIDNGAVLAMTVWDPIDVDAFGIVLPPVLVIGGDFVAPDGTPNLTTWDGAGLQAGLLVTNPMVPPGTDAPVRALATFTDSQEPRIGIIEGDEQEVLYIGGDFTTIWGVRADKVVMLRLTDGGGDNQGPIGIRYQRLGAALAGGVDYDLDTPPADPDAFPASVFALVNFDDILDTDDRFDRHARPATRVEMTVGPVEASFANMRVRVFDSNFNIVYDFNRPGSEDRDPRDIPPDPAGSWNPATLTPNSLAQLNQYLGFEVWGGEVYFVEISGVANDFTARGAGRYTMSLTVDAMATDLNGDGSRDEINGVSSEEQEFGDFAGSTKINTQLGTGDGSIYVDADTQPLHGNATRDYKFAGEGTTQVQTRGDVGNISSIDDTDLYNFRAEFTGTVEIRVVTTNYQDAYAEQITLQNNIDAAADNEVNFAGQTKILSSNLDSVLRIFRSDFEQIGYADDNLAILGDIQTMNVGGNQATYYRRDARIVINVVAGNVYYIQVESGQRFSVGEPVDIDDRTPTIDREIDWSTATGGYNLLIHQMPQQLQDVINGVEVVDDHSDGPAGAVATVIPMGTIADGIANGTGSVAGRIQNLRTSPFVAGQRRDTDLFSFISGGRGTAAIRVTPTANPSTLLPELNVFDAAGNLAGTGISMGGGVVGLDVTDVIPGQQFFIQVRGNGGSEGTYTVSVSGLAEADDHADAGKWANAAEVPIRDFLGEGSITGTLESAGDTDAFKFRVSSFSNVTIDVTSNSGTMDPVVTIYEVSEDPSGNPIWLRIGRNDNLDVNTVDSRSVVPVSPLRFFDNDPAGLGVEDRVYPYYYIVVQGADPLSTFGDYTVTVTFPPTDDHADGDTDLDGLIDTGEFDVATRIVVDSATGSGEDAGVIGTVVDTDLFVFAAPASGPASVLISRPEGSTFLPMVSIVSADGTVLATGSGGDAVFFFFAEATLDVVRGQDLYIVVAGLVDAGNPELVTNIGAYTVSVNAPPIDDYPNAGEFDLAASVVLNATTGIGQIGGSAANDPSNARLSPNGDTDLFTFVALAAGNVEVLVTPYSSGVGQFGPRVRVFDSSFNLISETLATTNLQTVLATFAAAAAGDRFYVLVSATEGLIGSTSTGEYQLRLTGVPSETPGGGDPALIDFNNPGEITLNPRTGDGEVSDTIEVNRDRDLYTFTTLAAGRVFVQLIAPDGSLLRASLRVLNQANENVGSQVALDSTGIPGAIANVAFDSAAGVTYYLVVDGIADSTGSYRVVVNTEPAVNYLYFPEGFANNSIREFVSIVNPNPVDVTYTVYLKYESSSLADTVVTNGTIRANSRDGLTIVDAANFITPGVNLDSPYSIVIESSMPLGATLAHYDFGSAIGDAFTERVSSQWNFARVERRPGDAADFIVFHNPNAFDVSVTLTAYQSGSSPVSLTRIFGADRRGGFSINDIAEFPTGTFSVILTSAAANFVNQAAFEGVVASLSHYELGAGVGFALLGNPDLGATEGVVTNLTQGAGVSSLVTLFNPGDLSATVTIRGTYIRAALPSFSRTLQILGKGQITLTGAELGLVADQPVGLTYTSDRNLTVAASQTQFGDADSTAAADQAGTRFFFGDAFIETSQAGTQYLETLYLHNPASTSAAISIKLLFLDGTTATFVQNVAGGGFAEIKLHERPEIVIDRSGPVWFSVDASAATPFVMSMTHVDGFLGGEWSTQGTPFGILNSLSLIS